MMTHHTWKTTTLAALLLVSLAPAVGCSRGNTGEGRDAKYQSAQIQGASQKINLDAVQKAFWSSKGGDFNTWMASFEKRVNEIYDGKDIVAIDASRKHDRLVVIGYIDRKKHQGYKPGDEKLFSIEQTGEATHDQVPYRMAGADNRPYYEGHHSLLDNPFLQFFLISHMMGGGWGGHYYTPYNHYGMMSHYRQDYRSSPGYHSQQAANQGFFSRFKQRALGGVQSKRGFGGGAFSAGDGAKRRSWGGNGNAATNGATAPGRATGATSSWGGRRSGASSGGRSWGGRRR